ncbi:MAG: hypothetical protein M1607_03275 [Patescibacteria group bacterium]|nr:hypothetical protein [Patescibacteria group bacterium]
MTKQGQFWIICLVAVVILIGVGLFYFHLGEKIQSLFLRSSPEACTQEAKQCPDGSFVGRTGPNCEFSPCPGNTITP